MALLKAAVNQGEVMLLYCPRLELMREIGMTKVVLGNDQQTGGVLVESMNDSRPFDSSGLRELRKVAQKGIHQGSPLYAGPNVHHHPGRLVNDSQLRVLINDV